MKKYKVFHSARFDKELSKFNLNFQEKVDRIENQLVQNPYAGKLLGVKWFRERKIEEHRVYYLVYDNLESVFMVAISRKKDQQKVINTIKLLFDYFRDEIKRLTKDSD